MLLREAVRSLTARVYSAYNRLKVLLCRAEESALRADEPSYCCTLYGPGRLFFGPWAMV